MAATVHAWPIASDSDAFESLVREHQGMVFSLAYHFLRDRAVAEELSQEVFLHLYRNAGSIESAAHLSFWLRKVTSHRCIDHARRLRFRPRVGLEHAPEPVAREAPHDPLLSGLLQKLVARLPERSRMIVILRYQEDLEPSEIASLLDVPVGTVKSNLHRALAVLRGKLERTTKGVRP
ncbi:MAG: RNA polymerase sigma factor [Bryobacteraceae bacterium]